LPEEAKMRYEQIFLAAMITLFVLLSGCTDTDQVHADKEEEKMPEIPASEGEHTMQSDPIAVSSPAFGNNGTIPAMYTCDGENINPELILADLPENTESLVLIVDDPDAPTGTFTHWTVWDIEPTDTIAENNIPGTQGFNDFGITDYSGPCPPSGTHRYFFRIYSLNTTLGLPELTFRRSPFTYNIFDSSLPSGPISAIIHLSYLPPLFQLPPRSRSQLQQLP
jgi:hypothetical protein